jgi:hypothetical protein
MENLTFEQYIAKLQAINEFLDSLFSWEIDELLKDESYEKMQVKKAEFYKVTRDLKEFSSYVNTMAECFSPEDHI